MFRSKIRYLMVTVGSAAIICLIGCSAENTLAHSTKDKNEINTESESNTLENESVNKEHENQISDLLYREYKIGSQKEAGSVLIPKAVVEENAENPEAIIIFYNDQILETVPYEKEDLTIDLAQSGWYCFCVLDGKNMEDISEKISDFESIENDIVTPLS